MRKVAGSHRGAIGTRLLNLSDAASDHPEPMVQDIRPGGTGGDQFSACSPSACSAPNGTRGRHWSCARIPAPLPPGPFGGRLTTVPSNDLTAWPAAPRGRSSN